MSKSTSCPFGEICGYTTVGERGQIVIPKSARDRLKLKSGTRFLIVEHIGKLILIPEDQVKEMVGHITGFLNKVNK